MIVQVPDGGYRAAVVAGWTQPQVGGAETFRGAVVVKAGYDLVENGAGPRRSVPAADPASSEIVFADEGEPFDGGFDLRHEADIALEKSRTDIVVEGFVADTADGSVVVDDEVWLSRAATVIKVRDTARNLFGWHSKTEGGRSIAVDEDFQPGEGDRLPDAYSAFFNNVYRRSTGFATPGNRNVAPLPSGGVVEIFKGADQGGTPYAFALPELGLTARLRTYCGHGPDEAPRWRIADRLTLNSDTLIVAPDGDRATILWRASWDWASEPQDWWRMVQIMRGSA